MLALLGQEIVGARNNSAFGTPPHRGLSLSKPSGGRRQLSTFQIHLRENPRANISSNANATILDDVATDEPSPKRANTGQYIGKRAVVIGAGPAGTVSAVLLAKRGFDVKVFEKRSHPSSVSSSVHRSIPLTLNPKASAIVKSMGAKIPKEGFKDGIHRAEGSAFISDKGIVRSPARLKGECIFGERHAIASNIIKAAEDQNLPNLRFFFDMPCEGVDTDKNIVQVGGKLKRYDLLIGADGVNSMVRKGLENSAEFEAVQYGVKSRYKSFRDIVAPAKTEGPFFETVKPGALGFVGLKKMEYSSPRAMVIYTNDSGMFQGSFLGTTDSFNEIKGNELEWLTEAVPAVFPKEWLEPIASRLETASESIIGPVTCCTSLVGPSIALVGDACHSVTPTFGIGANLAIRDTLALDEAMDFGDGDVESALKQYNKEWHPQVDSIMTLEKMSPRLGFQGSNTPWRKLWGLFFEFHVQFHAIGNKFLPWLIPQSVYRRIFSSELTGVQALRAFRREGVMVMAFVVTALYKTIAALARIAMGTV